MANKYWILRHGKSLANQSGTIVSSMEEGVKPEYGLNDLGRAQALQAGYGRVFGPTLPATTADARNSKELAVELASSPLVVLASPFSRTMQTAEGALQGMGLAQQQVVPEPALRERYFGAQLELQSDDHYPLVWAQDGKDAGYSPGGDGESVAAVAHRLSELMHRLDAAYDDATVLLVGHCDTLAILEATVRGTPLEQFRQYALKNCEFRRL